MAHGKLPNCSNSMSLICESGVVEHNRTRDTRQQSSERAKPELVLTGLTLSSLSWRRAPLSRESWEPQPPLSQHPHQNHRRVLTMSNPTNSLYHHNPGPGHHHLLLHGSATIHSSSHKTAGAIFSTWIALCLHLKILKQQQPTPTELPNVSSYPAPSLMAQSIQQLSFSA